jgi:L-ornithine Nalpha-acyltransferase
MARWLLDCKPLCGLPWKLGLATTSAEKELAYRLRYTIFVEQEKYELVGAKEGRDTDAFDDWCDQMILLDEESQQLIGTQRVIFGGLAQDRGGLYGHHEFDFTSIQDIVPYIVQGSRTCVGMSYRTGPAIQYLTYGLEMMLRELGAKFFLGAESFLVDSPHELCLYQSYLNFYGNDAEFCCQPQPGCEVPGLTDVPVQEEDIRKLPPFIRTDLRMGFRAISPTTWDPEFGCYDVLMLGRRDRLSGGYKAFIERIERRVKV